MNTQFRKLNHYLLIALMTVFSINLAVADDLMPPAYRGDPLSVHGHWQLVPGTNFLELVAFNWVDDTDPTTTLHPLPISQIVQPSLDNAYDFEIPNIIDKLPVKYLRLQLTWIGSPDSVFDVITGAVDDGVPIDGIVDPGSPVLPVDPAAGIFFQYYDIVYKPNPDLERIQVQLLPNAQLIQTVVDSVSTVPEPATLLILSLGSVLLRPKRS